MQSEIISAAVIIIGNEILSGKTQDENIQFIAVELAGLGIKLKEVRVVADIANDIIEAVNSLRAKYTYVFTTGGIGPTHDDITAETISKAFAVKHVVHPEALKLMEQCCTISQKEINDGYIRMASMPESAIALSNRETGAPGFKIENVFVMAGVPYIMRAIFQEAKKYLKHGKPIIADSIETSLSESVIAKDFGALQEKYPHIEMGSYPFKINDQWKTKLVLRGNDPELIEKVMEELKQLIINLSK